MNAATNRGPAGRSTACAALVRISQYGLDVDEDDYGPDEDPGGSD
jgi:hypothetical protein